MTPERWTRIKSVFQEALDLPESERDAFAVRRCDGDGEMLRDVRGLLAAHVVDDGFLARGDSGAVTLAIGSDSTDDAGWVLSCPSCGSVWPGGTVVCPTDGEPLEEDPADLVGRTLDGTYRLEALVGSGGFGIVYRARHELLGDRVAVKVLKRDLAASPDVIRRFVREGRVARAIRHENVVTIHDLRATPSGIVFLVMELLEGKTLRHVLEERGRLEVEDALRIVEQMAGGLDAAHALGVVHRDLKPENVMLVGEGPALHVKICDLGLAVLVEGSDTGTVADLTVPGQRLGSPRYMSPEQWGAPVPEGAPRIDARTDVYSLGVLATEILTGEAPFDGDSVWAMRDAHLGPARSVATSGETGVPSAVARVLVRAIARDRRDRFATAGDFSAALREAFATGANPPLARSERRHLASAALLLGASAVVAFGSVLAVWQVSAPPPAPPPAAAAPAPVRPYAEMSESEQLAFVADRARAVSVQLDGREYRVPPDARQAIKRAVDRYVARIGASATAIGREDIGRVLARGRTYAPYLRQTFMNEGLPAILGLYLPMIESEFRPDARSSAGARGMFQMLPSTAERLGLATSDLENVERSGPVAARYLRTQFEEFSGDRMGIALGLVAYNRGPEDVRRYLAEVVALDDAEAELRFWAMAGNAGFGAIESNETPQYVSSFFAAAIVGENPEAFGLEGPALSAVQG